MCECMRVCHSFADMLERLPDTDFTLLHSGAECASGDTDLGQQVSLEECAAACLDKADCTFFIYGYGSKEGSCYHESTTSAECGEGWESDDYNFYHVNRECLDCPVSLIINEDGRCWCSGAVLTQPPMPSDPLEPSPPHWLPTHDSLVWCATTKSSHACAHDVSLVQFSMLTMVV